LELRYCAQFLFRFINPKIKFCGRCPSGASANTSQCRRRPSAGGAALRGGRHLLTIAEGCVKRPSSNFGATAIKVRVTNFSGRID
jgi:hypothetical protein